MISLSLLVRLQMLEVRMSDPTTMSITKARQILNSPDNQLSVLITRAQRGGLPLIHPSGLSYTSAFKIRPMASDASSSKVAYGELIPGAVPSFNIWSEYGPGILCEPYYQSGGAVNHITYRLRTNLNGNTNPTDSGYLFQLGCFNDYNHLAVAPTFEISATKQDIIKTYISISVKFGDYNWLKSVGGTNDTLGFRASIRTPQGIVISTVNGVPDDPKPAGSQFDRVSGVLLDVSYDQLNVEIDVQIARWFPQNQSDPNKPILWTLAKALSLEPIIGVYKINNRIPEPTFGSISGGVVHITKQSVDVYNFSGNITFDTSFLYPTYGQPVPFPLGDKYMRVVIKDLVTKQVVHTQYYENIKLPEKQNDFIQVGVKQVVVNYPWQDNDLHIIVDFVLGQA